MPSRSIPTSTRLSRWAQQLFFNTNNVSAKNKRKGNTLFSSFLTLIFIITLTFILSEQFILPFLNGHYLNKNSFNRLTTFWHGRHLVFVVSPGRGGSKYMRNVLDLGQDVIARHEPEPRMHDIILKDVIISGKRNETRYQRAGIKISAIEQTLEGTPKSIVYAETSHMFVKTFADVVLDKLGEDCKISILFLQRGLKETVMSQLQLGWFSEAHSGKNVWYYDVNDVHKSEAMISYKTNSSDRVDSLIAYNADIFQRGIFLQKLIRRKHEMGMWKDVNIHVVKLEEITKNEMHNAGLLLKKLGIEVDPERLKMLGTQDKNSREVKKDQYDVNVSVEQIAQRIEELSNKMPILNNLSSG